MLLMLVIVSVEIAVLVSSGISNALFCETRGPAVAVATTKRKENATIAAKKVDISPLGEDEDFHGVIPRAFPTWSGPFPCFEPEEDWYVPGVQRSPAQVGLLYAKEMKTGSSTLSGVNIRIARGVAQRTSSGFKICKSRFDHSMATTMHYANRIKDKSFLWTVIRDPTKRSTSQFFHFQVSRDKMDPSDKNFKAALRQNVFQDYYLQSMAMTRYQPGTDDSTEFVNNILLDYDFIGITERMDESLVVLSMLLEGVELTDLLYLSAKGSGGYDDGRYKWKCVYIVPPYVSPTMQEFFASPEWKKSIVGDDLLFKAAWKSLDLTIDRLGRSEVEAKLEKFRAMKDVAEQTCADRVLFPCNPDGTRASKRTGCLWNDSGCGNQCLDEVAKRVK